MLGDVAAGFFYRIAIVLKLAELLLQRAEILLANISKARSCEVVGVGGVGIVIGSCRYRIKPACCGDQYSIRIANRACLSLPAINICVADARVVTQPFEDRG